MLVDYVGILVMKYSAIEVKQQVSISAYIDGNKTKCCYDPCNSQLIEGVFKQR